MAAPIPSPSPPYPPGPDMREKWVAEHRPATARFAKIILYTVSMVAAMLLLALGLLLGVLYWKKKGEQLR